VNLIEKEKIRYWRGEGLGYKAVAAKTGLTENAVKGYCKRQGLIGEAAPDTVCRQCGQPLEGTERKRFCGSACHNQWWNARPYLRDSQPKNRRACAHCGTEFFSDPGRNRKYCGHPCYVAHRFGGKSS